MKFDDNTTLLTILGVAFLVFILGFWIMHVTERKKYDALKSIIREALESSREAAKDGTNSKYNVQIKI